MAVLYFTRSIIGFILVLIWLPVIIHCQKDPHFHEGHTGIVHLFEWKYSDIAKECENYLGSNGFGGVQVTPVTENRVIDNRPWYERYQPVSYEINSRSGGEIEFKDMVKRCNVAKVRIYVDVILNHMSAGDGEIIGTASNLADPSKLLYPAIPFNRSHFHKPCEIKDYSDPIEVRTCQLVHLPDLDQSHPHVQSEQINLMNKLIKMGVAGFRVDAAKHMDPSELKQIFSKLENCNPESGFSENARPFIYLEVIDLGGESVSKYEYIDLGVVTEFKHSMELFETFRRKRTMHELLGWGPKHGFLQPEDALIFVDNHDIQRGHALKSDLVLNYKSKILYQMAVAFMLAHPYGIVLLMSSFEFKDSDHGPPMDGKEAITSPGFDDKGQCTNGWICEHRWPIIQEMVKFRNIAEKTKVSNWADNGKYQMGFCRGDKAFIAFNNEANGEFKTKIPVCVPPGQYCDIISGKIVNGKCTGKIIFVSNDRKAEIVIEPVSENHPGMIAFHVNSKLVVKNIKAAEEGDADMDQERKDDVEDLDEMVDALDDILDELLDEEDQIEEKAENKDMNEKIVDENKEGDKSGDKPNEEPPPSESSKEETDNSPPATEKSKQSGMILIIESDIPVQSVSIRH